MAKSTGSLMEDRRAEAEEAGGTGPLRRIEAREDDASQGLAQLVLTVVELLRQVLEREAVRRMETDTLTDDEVERVGRTLMQLREQMEELKETFGLEDSDLELDLGPLDDLL